MVNDSLGWWVTTKTGWWNGGSSPHHPVHCSDGGARAPATAHGRARTCCVPWIVAPIPTSAAATISSSSPMSASSEDPRPELSVPEFPSVSYFPMFRELDLFYFSA